MCIRDQTARDVSPVGDGPGRRRPLEGQVDSPLTNDAWRRLGNTNTKTTNTESGRAETSGCPNGTNEDGHGLQRQGARSLPEPAQRRFARQERSERRHRQLRIRASNPESGRAETGGCSGFTYVLDFDQNGPTEFDMTFPQHGVN